MGKIRDRWKKAAPDHVERGLHADGPNKAWLTGITEFAADDGKVCLSPLADCFDGKVVACQTSHHPDIQLVEDMLDRVPAKEKEPYENLAILADRGGHCRGARWIGRLEGQGIARSMPRKGSAGNNAACEGFFGLMKTEMRRRSAGGKERNSATR